jgi:transcription termination factor NusB
MTLEIILAVALASLIIAFIVDNQVLRKKNKNLSMILLQSYVEQEQLQAAIRDIQDVSQVDTTDGFVKFLSQSREWAYDYIDNVQSELEKFDNEMSKELKKTSLTSDEIIRISEAYDNLKQSVLPKNDEMPNN